MTSIEQTRAEVQITRTREDAGWELTIKITAYDKGLMKLNNRPIGYGTTGYLNAVKGCAEHVQQLLEQTENTS